MKLFEIDPDDSTVKLNKEWIMLIPEFAALFKRDKGSDGDYDGRKKLRTRKELTFVYFFVDFASPLTDWEEAEKWKESLHCANLTDTDIDEKVIIAYKKYDELQLKGARSLRSYRALLKTMDAMDLYFEALNFSDKDKKGELLNDPTKVATTVEKMDKMYTSIDNFRKRVEREMKDGGTGIRGTATLGDNEENPQQFSEQAIIDESTRTAEGSKSGQTTNMLDMGFNLLERMKKITVTDTEVESATDDKTKKE